MRFSDEVIIRQFKKEDLDAVTHILQHSFNSKFHALVNLSDDKMTELLKEIVVDKESFEGYWVAEKDDRVLGVMLLKWTKQQRIKSTSQISFKKLCKSYGFANIVRLIMGMILLHENTARDECYIEHIAVSPEARGLGIGSKLINVGKKFVEDSPYLSKYTLHVVESNKKAFRLYQDLGFRLKKSENSIISQLLLKEKTLSYMVNQLDDKAVPTENE